MAEKTETPTLHVFASDVEWVVAASVEDAIALAVKEWGPDEHDQGYTDPAYWKQLPDEKPLGIFDDESLKTIKLCREWAADNGRGFLCSTEF